MSREIKVGHHRVKISNEDKVFFPRAKITKGELVEYYRKVAKYALPHFTDRPLVMRRYPDGIKGESFVQQKIGKHFPKWVDRVTVSKENGKITHVVCNKPETLVYLAQEGSIENHVWLSRQDKPKYPDKMIFDLDPAGGKYQEARSAALKLKKFLDKRKLKSFVMTTGSKGYHVVVPLARRDNFGQVREYARELADELAARYEKRLTTEQRKNKRRGRVYIDTNRNAHGQTGVAPYSVRAREGAPVATPLTWQELKGGQVNPQKYTIKNIFKRLKQTGDPWKTIYQWRQNLK